MTGVVELRARRRLAKQVAVGSAIVAAITSALLALTWYPETSDMESVQVAVFLVRIALGTFSFASIIVFCLGSFFWWSAYASQTLMAAERMDREGRTDSGN